MPSLAAAACGGGDWPAERTEHGAIIFGENGRKEYFAEPDPAVAALLPGSAVALIPNAYIDRKTGYLLDAPTFADNHTACSSEPYAAEPAAAFCSGVLVDWDLVLTAGHCMRLLALEDFSVVFDYYYVTDGALALGPDSVATPAEIVSEAFDPSGSSSRLDYAWLRLTKPVAPARQPVPVRTRATAAAGDPLTTIGTPFGVPMKTETTGVITDARDGSDYFTGRADVSSGWSGGPAFDAGLAVTGIFVRGGSDLESAGNCKVETELSDDTSADEEFTYTAPALAALCQADPASSLCRSDCGDPCVALPRPPEPEAAAWAPSTGCALVARRAARLDAFAFVLVATLGLRRLGASRSPRVT